MQPITPYLTFPGTCEEAMRFYAMVLEAEITVMVTLADSPIEVPPEAGGLIFNSELRAGDLVIKASDDPEHNGISSSTSLFVTHDDAADRQRVFAALSVGGDVLFAPDGPFAMVRDRFGVPWMLTIAEGPAPLVDG